MVRPADLGGGGASAYRFPTYTPSSGEISADGSTLSETAGSTESVADTVAGKHNAAVDGVSGMIQSAMEGQDQKAKDMAVRIAQRAISGGGALTRFAGYVEEHDAKVSTWNGQIAAEPEDKQQKKYNELRPLWQDSVEELKTGSKAQQTARFLRQPLDVETIRSLFTAGAMPGATPAIFPTAHLSGEDQLEAVQARIRNGDIPPLADLTEEERLQLLDENPDLLPWLMGKEDPTDEEMTVVRDLAIPHLDGDDGDAAGQDVLDALDEEATPEDFARALGMVGGFGAYAKWAQEHGGPAIPSNRMDFLRNFYAKTGDKMNDIQDYIADDEHRYKTGESTRYSTYGGNYTHTTYDTVDGFPQSQQDAGMEDLANGLLTLSDHRLGGGWDELPEGVRDAVQDYPRLYSGENGVSGHENEDFQRIAGLLTHGDIAAGEGLSKELGTNAAFTLNNYDDLYPSGLDESLIGDTLELVSRNHEATTDLLAGGEDMPEGYYQSQFLSSVYGHEWDDHGAQVASMTDWIHQEHADAGPDQQLANQAFNGLASGLTSVGDDGIFRDLMGDGSDAAGKNNYELMNSLVDATSDHLYQIAAEPGSSLDQTGGLTPAQEVRLMTLMSTDHGSDDRVGSAERLAATVDAFQRDQINEWADQHAAGYGTESGPRELAGTNARLQGMLDSALINEASERGLDANQAEQQRVATIKAGSGMVASLAGAIPGVGTVAGPALGVGNSVLGNFLTADHIPPPPADIDPNWQADGSHVTSANGRYLLEALVRTGEVDANDLPDSVRHPEGVSNDEINDDVDEFMTDYLGDGQDFYGDYEGRTSDAYNWTRENFGLYHKDQDQIDEFLTSETWGRP